MAVYGQKLDGRPCILLDKNGGILRQSLNVKQRGGGQGHAPRRILRLRSSEIDGNLYCAM